MQFSLIFGHIFRYSFRYSNGETSLQPKQCLRRVGVQREAGHWRVCPCLPLSASGEFQLSFLSVLCIKNSHKQHNQYARSLISQPLLKIHRYTIEMASSSKDWYLFGCYYLPGLQVTNEKLAVKMCRLDLTPRNKDRWSKEIQIDHEKVGIHFLLCPNVFFFNHIVV